MQDTIDTLSKLIPVIISVIALLVTILKKPHEMRKLDAESVKADAEAASSYAEAAKTYSDEVLKLRAELNQERCARASLEETWTKRLDELKGDMVKLRQENAEYKDWAERLSHQVISLGAEPVPFRPRPKGRAAP